MAASSLTDSPYDAVEVVGTMTCADGARGSHDTDLPCLWTDTAILPAQKDRISTDGGNHPRRLVGLYAG
jgi:hypothetical protein